MSLLPSPMTPPRVRTRLRVGRSDADPLAGRAGRCDSEDHAAQRALGQVKGRGDEGRVHLMRFDGVEPGRLRDELARTGDAVEEAGVAWVSVMDHFFQMERAGFPHDRPHARGVHDAGLPGGAHLARRAGAAGHRGHLPPPRRAGEDRRVARRALRRPAPLGLGAAWYDREHAALGVPFPSLGERFERLEEPCRSAARCWTPTTRARTPAPITSSPRRSAARRRCTTPRSWSAGRASARRCAWSRSTPTRATSSCPSPRRWRTSSRCCGRTAPTSGRPSEIRVTALTAGPGPGDVDAFVEQVRPYAALGVDTLILRPPSADGRVGPRRRSTGRAAPGRPVAGPRPRPRPRQRPAPSAHEAHPRKLVAPIATNLPPPLTRTCRRALTTLARGSSVTECAGEPSAATPGSAEGRPGPTSADLRNGLRDEPSAVASGSAEVRSTVPPPADPPASAGHHRGQARRREG